MRRGVFKMHLFEFEVVHYLIECGMEKSVPIEKFAVDHWYLLELLEGAYTLCECKVK
jgi:hypothetical protein